MPGMEGKYVAHINHRTSTAHGLERGTTVRPADADAPAPPNVYGDRPFLVKLQICVSGALPDVALVGVPGAGAGAGVGVGMAESMMVYDRRRTAQAFVHLEDDAWTFAELVQEMKGPRGGYGGLKMYRWARRVGDWELSVCLDRAPGAAETRW